ncbi:alpha/beta hydrolase family protein [Salinispora arenicola]|uniref:alpha/beta hydrolase family protein n=1 Tax=Salinispora arenicola TaxID=168697 RepID=UPI0020C7F9F1
MVLRRGAHRPSTRASRAAGRPRIRAAGSIERDAEALRRLVDETRKPAEFYYYEAVSDPDARAMNRAQRSSAVSGQQRGGVDAGR